MHFFIACALAVSSIASAPDMRTTAVAAGSTDVSVTLSVAKTVVASQTSVDGLLTIYNGTEHSVTYLAGRAYTHVYDRADPRERDAGRPVSRGGGATRRVTIRPGFTATFSVRMPDCEVTADSCAVHAHAEIRVEEAGAIVRLQSPECVYTFERDPAVSFRLDGAGDEHTVFVARTSDEADRYVDATDLLPERRRDADLVVRGSQDRLLALGRFFHTDMDPDRSTNLGDAAQDVATYDTRDALGTFATLPNDADLSTIAAGSNRRTVRLRVTATTAIVASRTATAPGPQSRSTTVAQDFDAYPNDSTRFDTRLEIDGDAPQIVGVARVAQHATDTLGMIADDVAADVAHASARELATDLGSGSGSDTISLVALLPPYARDARNLVSTAIVALHAHADIDATWRRLAATVRDDAVPMHAPSTFVPVREPVPEPSPLVPLDVPDAAHELVVTSDEPVRVDTPEIDRDRVSRVRSAMLARACRMAIGESAKTGRALRHLVLAVALAPYVSATFPTEDGSHTFSELHAPVELRFRTF